MYEKNTKMYEKNTLKQCRNCISTTDNGIRDNSKMVASNTWIAIYFDEKSCSIQFNLTHNEIIIDFYNQAKEAIYLPNNKPNLDLTNRKEVLNFIETILTFS